MVKKTPQRPKPKTARRQIRKTKKLQGQFCMRRTGDFDLLLDRLQGRRTDSKSAVILKALRIMDYMDAMAARGAPLYYEDKDGNKIQLMDV